MGTERAQMMVDVMSKGIQNVVNDTLVSNTLEQKERIEKGEQENFNLQDLEKRKKLNQVVRKIRGETTNRLYLSKEVIDDAFMTKNVLDKLDTSSEHMRGYIQIIEAFPFGFNLLSEIQVCKM
jgi:hypothetical protein